MGRAEALGKIALEIGLNSGDLKQLAKAEKELTSSIDGFTKSATKVGFDKRSIQGVVQAGDKFRRSMRSGALETFKIQKAIEGFKAEHAKQLSRSLTDDARRRLNAQHAGVLVDAELRLEAVEKGIQREKSALESRIKESSTASRASAKDYARVLAKETRDSTLKGGAFEDSALDVFSSAMGDAFRSIKGGDAKGVGKGLAKMGGAAEAGGLVGMGEAATALAGAAASLAAIVGPIALILGVIYKADQYAKELNKTLLETGGVADLSFHTGVRGAVEFRDALETVRSGVEDFAYNAAWRVTAQDQMKIIANFNEAGFTVKEMTKGAEDAAAAVQKIHAATSAVLTYSKLLGTSEQEMAQNISEYMDELGVGLKDVQKGLGAVTVAASMSGFGTKRFYTMVQQATSGMALYNVRMEEAASLLLTMGKAMNPRMAGEFMKSLAGGLGGRSLQDRLKEMMITGKKGDKALKSSAEAQADRFSVSLSSAIASKDIKGTGSIGKLTGKKGTELLDAIRGMNADEQRRTVAQLSAQGTAGENQSRSFQKLIDLSKGTAKGAGAGAKAIAAGQIDMTGQLLMGLQTFSGKPISELSIQALMGEEAMRGLTAEQIEQRRLLDRQLRGSFSELQAIAQSGEPSGMTNEEMLERFGGVVKDGQVWSATKDASGKVSLGKTLGKDFDAFVLAQGHLIDVTDAAVSKDQALAQEVVRNTRDIAVLLENTTNWLLSSINTATLGVWKKIANSKERIVIDAIEESQKKQLALVEDVSTQDKGLRSLQTQIASETDPKKRKELEVKQSRLQADQSSTKRKLDLEQLVMDLLQKGGTKLARFSMSGNSAEATRQAAFSTMPREDQRALVEKYQGAGGAQEFDDTLQSRTRDKAVAYINENMAGLDEQGNVQNTGGLLGGPNLSVDDWMASTIPGQGMENEAAGELVEELITSTGKWNAEALKEDQATSKEAHTDSKTLLGEIKNLPKEEQKLRLREELAKLDVTGSAMEKAVQAFQAGKFTTKDTGLTAEQLSKFKAGRGGVGSPLSPEPKPGGDFIWRPGQPMTRFNSKDTLLAGKPGGALDKAGAGGSGTVNNVTLNINGGDPQELYRQLKQWGVI